ncbi:MAG: TIGR03619 family F420-dependent LLM class oxidoreductase [Gammaproteobacteria bacterium]|nr:TIGR03619 family F420-dependent LLM class oxidoreductase [Gammaproteobacteria bacterium]
MKFWQGLMFLPTEELVEIARCAEQAGFTGVILSDHLVTYQTQQEAYPQRDDGRVLWGEQTHWPDPWIAISAMAQATTSLQFTTAVYILTLRDPFSVAKSLSTLAVMSGNRVAMGAGIGWQQSEFDLLGQRFDNRGRRADEALTVIRKLTTGANVSHDGEFYQFPALCMTPAPSKPLPIYIGGESDAALRRAARHDGWIGTQYSNTQLLAILERLQRARRDEGTTGNSFEIIVGTAEEADRDLYTHLEDLGVTAVMTSSWPQQADLHCDLALSEKCRHIEAFADKFIH